MIGRAETQATFARLLYYAPQNAKAFDLMPPELARLMPTFPANERIARGVQVGLLPSACACRPRRAGILSPYLFGRFFLQIALAFVSNGGGRRDCRETSRDESCWP